MLQLKDDVFFCCIPSMVLQFKIKYFLLILQ